MFFVLSGFIICWAMPPDYSFKNCRTFIAKRITRIEPPYIVSIALLILLNWLSDNNYQPDWLNVVLHLGYLNGFLNHPFLNPVYWTLALEFQFYLFAALVFPFLIKKYGAWLVLVFGIFPLLIQTPSQLFLSFSPVFGLGVLMFLFLKRHVTIFDFSFVSLSLAIATYWLLGWLPALAAVFCALIILLPLQKNIYVHFFSQISFSLYLTHDIIGSRLVVYLGSLFPKTVFYKGSFFLIGIAVSILFAWVYYKLIEKPCMNLSKAMKYHNTAAVNLNN